MDRGEMNRLRSEIQQLAARDVGKTRQDVEQRQAALSTATYLPVIAQLLETLIEEVRGLQQHVAAIKASMPSAVTDEQPPANAPRTVLPPPSNQRGPARPPQEPASAEREWQDSEADNRGQSEQG